MIWLVQLISVFPVAWSLGLSCGDQIFYLRLRKNVNVLFSSCAQVREESILSSCYGWILSFTLPHCECGLIVRAHELSIETQSQLSTMLFFSYFKELVGKEVIVELKNDLAISGILHSVDQYLNIKLENTRVVDDTKYPHMLSVKNCFIRGSVVRYVQLPPDGVDVDILHDATRREARGG